MRLSDAQRELIRSKFGGRCSYCGVALPRRWHVDHLEPVHRMDWIGQATLKPENHRIDNCMPSCAPCNISKGPMSLEVWRSWLEGHVRSLNAHHSIYRIAKAFGLVQETGALVQFHFERIAQGAPTDDR